MVGIEFRHFSSSRDGGWVCWVVTYVVYVRINSSVITSLVVLISSIRRFVFGNRQNNMRMVVVIILLKIFRGG